VLPLMQLMLACYYTPTPAKEHTHVPSLQDPALTALSTIIWHSGGTSRSCQGPSAASGT
jgi:hypothetical protein